MTPNELIGANLDQMWFNVVNMDKESRKKLIKWICNLNRNSSGFIHYYAKSLLVQMIAASECYFNGVGYTTQVKEFKKLGFYIGESLEIDSTKIN